MALLTSVTLELIFGVDRATAESGPAENAQVGLWCLSVIGAMASALQAGPGRERWFCAWLAVMAALAAARELDTHFWLNPEYLGDWGVRYRVAWWLKRSTPVLPRVMWGGIGLLAAASVSVLLLKSRPHMVNALRRGDPMAWSFAAAVLALGIGYAADDLLEPGRFVDPLTSRVVEESAETVGAACFLAGVAVAAMRSRKRARLLDSREPRH